MQAILNKLSLQFLCGLPLNEFSFPDTDNVNVDLESQEILLNATINSDLVLKYPLKISYQKVFAKHLLNTLEKQGKEIHEDLYSAYGRLVALSDSKSEYYKHYPVGDSGTVITLKENVNLISEGTTGLRTWQASLALGEWCLENQEFLCNKSILELGSGIGLTGLVASLKCQLKKFNFSDCHHSVLKTLCENIDLNYKDLVSKKNDHTGDLANSLVLERQLQSGVHVSVLNLPWGEVDNAVCEKLGKIDLILAADVVYDDELFKPLIKALNCISKVCQVEDIVFACTERNVETLDSFLQKIGEHFQVNEEECPSQKNFIWSPIPPVRFFRFKLC